MAKPRFSETQFVVGYLREYLNSFPFFPHIFWWFHSIRIPSTVEEAESGADFIFRHYSHSEFFQFKRSYCLSWRGRGHLSEPEKSLPKAFFDYYRFKVYNSADSRQFEKLREVSIRNPRNRSYYIAPLFHTNEEFTRLFARQQIIENSVIINCAQFNEGRFLPPYFDIGTDSDHKIIFNEREEGYIFSDPIRLRLSKGKEIDSASLNGSYDSLNIEQAIIQLNDLLNWCLEDFKALNDTVEPENLKTFRFIYNYFLSNYNIHWIPRFNNNQI
jgi:hypothetical protein